MNDTHGQNGQGWYGFDLDGTLAVYDNWRGIDHIGEPITPMVDLIKKLHDEGKVVKILTARVAPRANIDVKISPRPFTTQEMDGCPWRGKSIEWTALEFIQEWCHNNLGFVPEITHEKDHLMLELYDDRVKQVVPNKGELVEDIVRIQSREIQKCERIFNGYERENLLLSRKLDCKFNGFLVGMMLGSLIALAINLSLSYFLRSKTPQNEALNHLHSAIIEVQEALGK